MVKPPGIPESSHRQNPFFAFQQLPHPNLITNNTVSFTSKNHPVFHTTKITQSDFPFLCPRTHSKAILHRV